jgi:hypothetical protein
MNCKKSASMRECNAFFAENKTNDCTAPANLTLLEQALNASPFW